MIVSSAVKLEDGRVFVGRRHGDCYTHMMEILQLTLNELPLDNSIQGFLTDKGQFLNRQVAYWIALDCEQCKEQFWTGKKYFNLEPTPKEEWKPMLISEHLWDGD
jgi:hypothetical protein